ncbi:helix-turn-helix domain-containing protein, partial [Vibrio campbellii]
TLPTSDVAWESGYSDLSNFNRAFKTWTGMTPSMYRKQHRASST